MVKPQYLPNGAERFYKLPHIVRCSICDFDIRRWQSVESFINGQYFYRHKDLQLCDRLAEQKRFHNKLIGDLNATLDP